MSESAFTGLLDTFPLTRAHTAADAAERIGRIFSPHRLEVRGRTRSLDVHHNQVRMRHVTLNTLTYGAEVMIDPGERGDFYMVQLPLAGHALLVDRDRETRADTRMLTVLQPRARGRMIWSADCRMILVQVPRDVVEQRASEWGLPRPRFATARSRRDPQVAAWWQAVVDLTCNLDRFGEHWLRHPAACAAMEEFLLSAFTSMLGEPDAVAATAVRSDERCLRRAKDYVQEHLGRALTLPEIARHVCVSPRTLEAAFKRGGELSPLAYARRERLLAVDRALRGAARERREVSVTEVALEYGFVHMGRFAAQYRRMFGCAPSETLHPH